MWAVRAMALRAPSVQALNSCTRSAGYMTMGTRLISSMAEPSATTPKPKIGRPKGSKNKTKPSAIPHVREVNDMINTTLHGTEPVETAPPKRRSRRSPKPQSESGAEATSPPASSAAVWQYGLEPLYSIPDLQVSPEEEPYCHPHMPHPSTWKAHMVGRKQTRSRHRYFVANKHTVQDIVSRMGLDSPEREKNKVTIVEAYPGPGTFTRAFLEHPNVERVIALEDVEFYLHHLDGKQDHLQIVRESGFIWDTYDLLVRSDGLLHLSNRLPKLGPSSPPMDWDATCPLIFFAQLPNTVHGEQLFAQLVHAISSRHWLYKYGRLEMFFVCSEALSQRVTASCEDARTRAKLGVTTQCLSEPSVILPPDGLEPFAEHMFPPSPTVGPRVPVTSSYIPNSNMSTGLQKRKLTAIKIDPLRQPLVHARDMDSFEFLTRNLFVLRTKTVQEALKHVAPGAHNILRMVSADHERMKDRPEDVVPPDAIVYTLTNRQWAALAEAFEKWPFKPDTQLDEGSVRRGTQERLY